jgi:predicted MPP superfamily phosphohydrolase
MGTVEFMSEGIVAAGNMPEISFGSGWIITFAAVFYLNAYLLFRLFAVDFGGRRLARALTLSVPAGALAACFFVYFTGFFGGRAGEPYMQPLAYVAGFWMVFSIYAGGIFFIAGALRMLRNLIRRIRRVAVARRKFPRLFPARFTLVVVVLCAVLAAASFYAPRHIVTTRYDATLARGDSPLAGLRICFFSDTHIGPAIRERQLDEIVRIVNAQHPDIILLGGDIVDEGTPEALKEYMAESFKGFESRYGAYYILGNHDDYRGDTREVLSYFEEAGMHPLLDEVLLIDDSFYLIGREDSLTRRVSFAELASQVTEDLPVVVLDHQPRVSDFDTAAAVGMHPLQISGHTHDGQIFPFHILDPTGRFWLNYGFYARERVDIIVSSGTGEFAVPNRLGSPAEIVTVDLKFYD